MIWLIGGTSESIKIANLLALANLNVLVSTTTTYGAQLAALQNIKVIKKEMLLNDMLDVIKINKINTTIDASHPFAQNVSKNAIKACHKSNIQYIRFEREVTPIINGVYYNTYEQICDVLKSTNGNILFTIGSKNINQFKSLQSERLIARVLPVNDSLELCKDAGLKAHQIIAMKGRMTKDTNKAIMLEYKIKHLVTKDSGEEGGVIEKVDAANELGIKIHVLKRPSIEYPKTFQHIEDLVSHLTKQNNNNI